MKFTRYIIQISALLVVLSLSAQQQPNYALYRYTMNAINPAYAGADGLTSVVLNFRSQWQGVENAPDTQTFFFHTPVNDNIGLGLTIVNDQVFVENATDFMVDFSYKLQINATTDLFLGLKGGGGTYNIDNDGFANSDIITDPAIGALDTGFRINFGLGAYILHEDYFVSLSAPRLLLGDRIDANNQTQITAQEKIHVFLSGGYDFDMSSDWAFRPSTMLRYSADAPLSVDITTAFRYKKRFEVSGMYRTDGGWGGLLMLNITDWIDIGYAYEGATREVLNNVNDGTHEFFARFNILRP